VITILYIIIFKIFLNIVDNKSDKEKNMRWWRRAEQYYT